MTQAQRDLQEFKERSLSYVSSSSISMHHPAKGELMAFGSACFLNYLIKGEGILLAALRRFCLIMLPDSMKYEPIALRKHIKEEASKRQCGRRIIIFF